MHQFKRLHPFTPGAKASRKLGAKASGINIDQMIDLDDQLVLESGVRNLSFEPFSATLLELKPGLQIKKVTA